MGREWPNLGGLAPRHTQRPPIYRDPLFPRPCQKKTDTVFTSPADTEENIDRYNCHGHSQVLSSLAAHLRPPLPVAPMTAGRLRKMYTRSRRRVDEQAVAKYGVIL